MPLIALLLAALHAPPVAAEGPRARLVAAARGYVGQRPPVDCSGFVRRVWEKAGVPLPARAPGRSGSESLYRSLTAVRRPRPGDLAFFHHTWDRDPPGPRANRFTHVAMVEAVKGARVTLIHRGSRGVRRLTMNLARPRDPAENGAVRRRRPGDPPQVRTLAGELFAGYASALPQPRRAARVAPPHAGR